LIFQLVYSLLRCTYILLHRVLYTSGYNCTLLSAVHSFTIEELNLARLILLVMGI